MIKTIQNNIILVSLLFLQLFSIQGFSQVPQISQISPAMIEQFKNMPLDQQRRLAKQYGVDIGVMGMQGMQNFDGYSSLGTQDSISLEANEESNQVFPEEFNIYQASPIKKNEDEIPIFEKKYNEINELKRFGSEIFNKTQAKFTKVDNAPVPRDYLMGVGDTLNLLMFGSRNEEHILTIDREGMINIPNIGVFSVSGLNFQEVRALIKDIVNQQIIGAEVSVSMGRLRSMDIFIAGEIRIPGNYSVSGLSTVLQLIYTAGGINEIGSYRNIEVLRNDNVISSLDVYQLLTAGKRDGDIRLQSGDLIFVPSLNKEVIIDGGIRRPGKYELKDGENIDQLIKFSGGFRSRAYKNNVLVERFDSNSKLPKAINLDLSEGKNSNFPLMDGDIIRIEEVLSEPDNLIKLKGAVSKPGNYSWSENIRFSSIINNIEADLLDTSDLNFGLIIRREKPNSRDIISIGVNPSLAALNPDSEYDIELEPFDHILIFDNDDSNEYLTEVSIDNEIYKVNKEIRRRLNNYNNPFNTFYPTNQYQESTNSEENSYEVYSDNQINKIKNDLKRKKNSRKFLIEPYIKKLKGQASFNKPLQTVAISGAVRFPGEYPILKDNSILKLIEMAGNLKGEALIENAEIRRVVPNNKLAEIEFIEINLNDTDLNNSDLKLQSRDHVRVNATPDWNPTDTIEVTGEVMYPGRYLIGSNETLSSVIERAGGITIEAFPQGAIFSRESVRNTERQQLTSLANDIRRDQVSRSLTKEAETGVYSIQNIEAGIEGLMNIEVGGRLIVDMLGIISGNPESDVILQGGDSITVPKKSNAVTVVGEVRRSGSFVYEEDLNYNDYIDLSAGLTDRANKKAIYIIKANGSVIRTRSSNRDWLNFGSGYNNGSILPGDTVVVPLKSSYQTPLNLYSQVSSVVFQSLASIAAFFQIAD